MHPILWQSDGWTISTWHVFYVLGALLAWWTLHILRPYTAPELPRHELDRFFVLIYIASYLGARLLSIFVEGEYKDPDFHGIASLFQLGSMTLYGGIIAGALTLIGLGYWRKIKFLHLADLFSAPLLLGVFMGRIGCFFNGDDFGKAVANQEDPPWWAVQFPNLGDQIYRYPVQIWESLLCGILAVILLMLAKRPREAGRLADGAVVGYCFGRLVLESFRGDDRGTFFFSTLSTSQGISILALLAWVFYRNFISSEV